MPVEPRYDTFDSIERVEVGDQKPVQQVWPMTRRDRFEDRIAELIETGTRKIIPTIGDGSSPTDELVATWGREQRRPPSRYGE